MKTKAHTQKRSHPFRRFIATTEDNARDEFFVINHGSIIADRGGNPGDAINGGGR